MKTHSINDYLNHKWYNNPRFPIFPFIRKFDGNSHIPTERYFISWFNFTIYFDNYHNWRFTKTYIDSPYFRVGFRFIRK